MNKKSIRNLIDRIQDRYYGRNGFTTLEWFPEYDFGFVDCDRFNEGRNVYDEAYFKKYVSYRETRICQELNEARVKLVTALARKIEYPVVHDFGSGACDFIKKMIEVAPQIMITGQDINQHSLNELNRIGKYNPNGLKYSNVLTFWDSIEHVPLIGKLLDSISVGTYVVMTIPIAFDSNHAFHFKHYRPDEHYWYFTRNGLVTHFMPAFGFKKIDIDDITQESHINEGMEEYLGRRDVSTFVFQRVQMDEL